jgi:hypothetical protein
MPRWEYCEIEIAGISKEAKLCAYVFSSRGIITIDATPVMNEDKYRDQYHNECAKLIGRLIDQGWEPIGFNNGHVVSFKRYVP